jgi:hypothetical protein
MDYIIETFMRIIFRGTYIQNKEIVKVEINEPWKMCYQEGLKLDPRLSGKAAGFHGNDRSEMAEKERDDANTGPLRRNDSEASKSDGKQTPGKRILLRTYG